MALFFGLGNDFLQGKAVEVDPFSQSAADGEQHNKRQKQRYGFLHGFSPF